MREEEKWRGRESERGLEERGERKRKKVETECALRKK